MSVWLTHCIKEVFKVRVYFTSQWVHSVTDEGKELFFKKIYQSLNTGKVPMFLAMQKVF